MWAAVNLGARLITDAGLFYQWGALNGHNDASEFSFSEANYESQQLDRITEDLTLEQDAASVYFGDPSVRMPSRNDFIELFYSQAVTVSSRTISGVRGFFVQSNITGNSLFFPITMGRYRGSSYESVSYPHLWTRSYVSSSDAYAGVVSPTSGSNLEERWCGFTIRPVKKP